MDGPLQPLLEAAGVTLGRLDAASALLPDKTLDYPYLNWTFQDWSALYAPETSQTGRDLVFFTGGFVQWPAGVEVRP